jgi:4-alpha-glucanotransferase
MSARPELEALAARLGIVPAFFDLAGQERRASDATREALVAGMGHDASSEAAARRSLVELARTTDERLLDPVQVWREHAASLARLELRAGPGALSGRIELRLEDGRVLEAQLAAAAGRDGRVSLALPCHAPQGYHRVRVELDDGRETEQLLVVVPRTAPRACEFLGGRRAFGVSTNLYTVRGRRGLGYGDFTDLHELLELVGSWGGDFVSLNPLHALRNRGESISPYSPVSRLWRNMLYIDVESVPEFEACEAARSRLATDGGASTVRSLREADRIDHAAVRELKLGLLRELHRTFLEGERAGATARGREYTAFTQEAGDALLDFATFEALAEGFPDELDWRRWPERYLDPRAPAVLAFRRERAEALDLQCWIQFELERQLAVAARAGRAAGLAFGLVNDLAVGSPPDSADAWAEPGLVTRGVSIGAPPDAFAADGQDWGLAPIDPNRLRADGYRLWTRLLRASFRHAGGLRIDHAIGLERSFWIPEGRPGREGAYVLQPADDLLGILALEARRAGALVIGEDLGVVPAGLKRRLASWGLLSTSVLLFERDGDGFRAPERYSPRAFVTATTHDLVPLAGYAAGTDVELRAQLEALDGGARAALLEARRRDVLSLTRALDGAGVPADAEGDAPSAQRVHRFLARTPAPLLALSLDDLGGEREPINLPGISTGRHRSWSRRMSRPLRSIAFDQGPLRERVREVGTGRDGGPPQDGCP